jgi:hypothetical protein
MAALLLLDKPQILSIFGPIEVLNGDVHHLSANLLVSAANWCQVRIPPISIRGNSNLTPIKNKKIRVRSTGVSAGP